MGRISASIADPIGTRGVLATPFRNPLGRDSMRIAQCRVRPRWLIVTCITTVSVCSFLATPSLIAAESIGPGIAGQIKALAYDPDHVDEGLTTRIFAGGDVCGVYVTDDDGDHWRLWNKGLEEPGGTLTFYVDDLIVIGSGMVDPANLGAAGVYAATHGGIYFRKPDGASWDLATDYTTDGVFRYRGDESDTYAQYSDCPVPFSCFAYDQASQVLYAGAGYGGHDVAGEPWRHYYPESGSSGPQYSLWACDLSQGHDAWSPIIATDGLGIARQIAIVEIDSVPRVVFASRSGIYLLDANRGGTTDLLLGLPASEQWSGLAWGVAAGGADRLYAIFQRAQDPVVLAPSVQMIELGDPARHWTQVGDLQQIVYPHDVTWESILTDPLVATDLYSLTVVPGTSAGADQVYVGSEGTSYGGYFRHGPYQGGSGWIHIIYLEPNTWDEGLDQHYVDWSHGALATAELDVGWLDQHILQSTVPLIVDPADTEHMFAMAYHFPLTRDPLTGDWAQKYCTESGNGWTSTGLNLMSQTSVDATAAGRLVIGCGDFQCFMANDDLGTAFVPMNPYRIGSKDVYGIQAVGDTVFTRRLRPHRDGDNFGFAAESGQTTAYQQEVIAQYAPELADAHESNGDGYGWRFPSRGLDAVHGYGADADYKVTAFVAADVNTIYAATAESGVGHPKIFRGTRVGDDWTWEFCAEPSGQKIMDMEVIPGRDLIALACYKADAGDPDGALVGLEVMRTQPNQSGTYEIIEWLGPNVTTTSELLDACVFAQTLAVDPDGNVLYLGSHGDPRSAASGVIAGALLRLRLGSSDSVEDDQWEVLASGRDELFQIGLDAVLKPSEWQSSTEYSERSFNVKAIAIDPENPMRVFMGLTSLGIDFRGGLDANQGVYEYRPDESGQGGTWHQTFGLAADGEPTCGVSSLLLRADDTPHLIVGTFAQEFFRVGVTAASVPVVGPRAIQPLYPGQTVLEVDVVSATSAAIDTVYVDASALGLASHLALLDDGLAGDAAAGDGVWSVSVAGYAHPAGIASLPIVARDDAWNTYRGEVEVVVLDEAPVGADPTVNDTALEAIHPAQRVFMLVATAAAPATVSFVNVTLPAPWLPQVIELNDDGPGEDGTGIDWQAGDGVWTGSIAGDLPPAATYQVLARVGDTAQNRGEGLVQVEVVDEPGVYFKNVSARTTLDEAGMPTGVAPIDVVHLQDLDIDTGRDVFIGRFDDAGTQDPEGGMLVFQTGRDEEAPVYSNQSDLRFGPAVPGPGHGPASTADLDNDGLMDLVIPSGSSSEGLLFYKQGAGGVFQPMDWAPATAIDDADTWAAVCADYDGDGLMDIYLCRAHVPSGDTLPGLGHGALPDILLKNDLVNTGRFVDASAEVEIPLNSRGVPQPLASRTAAWGDFDDDGDPDLAVADAASGRGFVIYQNSPGSSGCRFEVIYKASPAINTADLTWVDRDGNGDLELLVATFWGDGWPGEAYFYDYTPMVPSNPFIASTPLPEPPPHAATGARVADVNLDGHLDFVLLPLEANGVPQLALNSGAGGSFGSPSSGLGFAAFTGAVNGGLLADLNDDGGPDLFLGRTQTDLRFFGAAAGADLQHDWLGLELVIDRDGLSAPAVGAKVVVHTGNPSQGSVGMTVAADGRSDHVLKLGYPAGASPTCDIVWPNGARQTGLSLAGPSGTVHAFTEPGAFTLDGSSVVGTSEQKPYQLTDMIFRWTTSVQTDVSQDRVIFDLDGDFPPPREFLVAGEDDVTVSQWLDNRGATPVYRHELRFSDYPCNSGYLTFTVESGLRGTVLSQADNTINLLLCTSNKPDYPEDPPGEGGL
ncbi:MAG: VCBS repeat-containing protein [Candidatus Krumholzibacteriia bacterium]